MVPSGQGCLTGTGLLKRKARRGPCATSLSSATKPTCRGWTVTCSMWAPLAWVSIRMYPITSPAGSAATHAVPAATYALSCFTVGGGSSATASMPSARKSSPAAVSISWMRLRSAVAAGRTTRPVSATLPWRPQARWLADPIICWPSGHGGLDDTTRHLDGWPPWHTRWRWGSAGRPSRRGSAADLPANIPRRDVVGPDVRSR